MNSSQPKYENYKDSGVEWLGEIPEHWEVIKMKYLCKIYNGDSIKDEKKSKYESINDSDYPYISTKDIDLDISKIEYENGLRIPVNSNFKIAQKDSFLLCIEGGSAGRKIAFLKQDVCFVNKLACFKTEKKNHSKYFYYFAKSYFFQNQFQLAMTGLIGGVAISLIKNFETFLPPLQEQTAIASFIDQKTAKIDQAIAQKVKLIELLKERRQILIHNAVTKGIHADVKLKDSGVEWIGEIPEHWEVKKIKYIFKLIGGGTPTKERLDFWNGDIPWVSPKDMKSDYIYSTEDYVTRLGLERSSSNFIESGNLLMVVRSGILQRKIPVAISKVGLTINQDMKAFIPIGNLSTEFFFNYILGNDKFLKSDWVKQGATVESVEMELLKNGVVPIPSLKEQKSIVSYIELNSQKIATAISCKEKEIEKLKEYKATLINSAVTGKIKVSRHA